MISVFLVFPQESFNNVKQWLDEINRYACENVSRLLVGNKSDLVSKKVVDAATAQVTGCVQLKFTTFKLLRNNSDHEAH